MARDRTWLVCFATPSGTRILRIDAHGTRADMIADARRMTGTNPEWSLIEDSIERVDLSRLRDRVKEIEAELAKTEPDRPDIREITGGQANRILSQPWLDPKSKEIPDPEKDSSLAKEMGMLND